MKGTNSYHVVIGKQMDFKFCNFPDCLGTVYAEGLCSHHYAKWCCSRYRWLGNITICCVDGCNEKINYHEVLCKTHYSLYRRTARERELRENKYLRYQERGLHGKSTCEIIYKHSKDESIKNDPNALGAEYIEKAVGVECKKLHREKKEEQERMRQKRVADWLI